MSSLGTLTAGVAHEINNPLNFISGGINVIKEMKEELESKKLEDLNERCKTATEMLGTGLDRVSGIVKSLMTFSQRGTPRLIEYNIHQLIDNTLLFINKKITDDIEIARDFKLKEKVAVYPEKIHFIFTNILDNAIFFLKKHEPARKKIVISTIRTNNNASIRIFNTGPNIPDEQLTKVFDPFFTTKDPEQGTGLGLSICYTFINEHNGRIYAENEENGVSFVVELPVSVK
jgi:signal transduction histidine kinase